MSYIFVGNLSQETDDESLRRCVQKHVGAVCVARVARDAHTEPASPGRGANDRATGGYGYVSFATEERAWLACQYLRGVKLHGRPMHVRPVLPE